MKTVIRVLIPFVVFLMTMGCSSSPNFEGNWYDCSNNGGYDMTVSKDAKGYVCTIRGKSYVFEKQSDHVLKGFNGSVTINYVDSTKHLIITELSDVKEYCKK